jgi:lipopolysaccharide transport system ATP-binding protein
MRNNGRNGSGMMSPVIQVEGLSKRYRIGLKEKRKDTLFAQLGATLRAPIENFRQLRSLSRFDRDDESVFWALRDISFDVHPGEVLGIIGHNGAGKSTLLKILSRITEPSEGRVTIYGRIGALLEVGTGFHPELTGRDNIYMNGTILGMTRKEIDQKFDEIIDFSGVEKYIDTPVKFYSSGMKVRLGFAVAAHLEPEILVIDEVLAVGDAEFQKKCLGKMEEVSQGSAMTLLFVSHNMAAVRSICTRCIVISKGAVAFEGDVSGAIKAYSRAHTADLRDAHFTDVRINDGNGIFNDERIAVTFKSDLLHEKLNGYLFFILANSEGEIVVHNRIRIEQLSKRGDDTVEVAIDPLFLRPGPYSFHLKIIPEGLHEKPRFVSNSYLIDIQPRSVVDLQESLGLLTPTVVWR